MTISGDGTGRDDNDPTAARLRAALNAEAAMIEPSDDNLQTIRERTSRHGRPWWQSPAVLAVAAALLLVAAVGGAAALLRGGDGPERDVVAGPGSAKEGTPTGGPSGPDATGDTTATPTAPDGTLEQDLAWVYYLMDDPVAGPRLYREQHTVTASEDNPLYLAVEQMLSAPALDSDYTSLWPEGTGVHEVSVDGDTATVDLTAFVAVGAEFENASVQQLVHTVTANDPTVTQVRLLVDGEAPESGHSDWSEPVRRAPAVDVMGFIWLLEPREDSLVESPVKIVGYGTAFEGTVSWEVRQAGSDEVVAEGFTQAGANGEFADFQDTVELEPGEYEIRAFESSAEDGRPLHVDDKTFTVGTSASSWSSGLPAR